MHYIKNSQKLISSGEVEEIIFFQYQRMMRYGGQWHLERRAALPGCVFLAGTNVEIPKGNLKKAGDLEKNICLTPCEIPYLRELCQNKGLIAISRGIIRDGVPVVTSGPLTGRERLIRKIDRHKRTARIEIFFNGEKKQVTVGLEIYEKETQADRE